MSDSVLSAAHRVRPLLDLVDAEWAADALSDDDLCLPDEDAGDTAGTQQQAADDGEAEQDEAVLTDGQGVTWVLSLPKHAPGAAHGQRPILAMEGAAGTAHAALESADGMRWLDLGLQGFAAQAERQPAAR